MSEQTTMEGIVADLQEASATPESKARKYIRSVEDKITAVHAAATDDDKAKVAALVARATGSREDSVVMTITPGMAALLFWDHNKQNREWKAHVSEQYADEVSSGEWHFTNQGFGFLVSGNVGDGQHRLGGIAIGGKPVLQNVVFGMTPASIIAIDIGHRRQASDFLNIEKGSGDPKETKRKQAIVKQAFASLRRLAGDNQEESRKYFLRPGNADLVKAIKAHPALLVEAMEIGDESVRGYTTPTFKANEAAAFSFMLLLKGWPKAKLIADLDVFQSGQARDSDKAPLFVAADQLQRDKAKRESAGTTARFAAAAKAFVLHEQGVNAMRPADLRNALKGKTEIDARFPGATIHQMTA